MSDLTRLVSAALIAAMLVMAGMPARADDRSNPAASESWWDSVRGGPKDIFDYGLLTIRSLADWVTGGTPNPSDGKTEDIRSLLNLSDKEFREFDALIHAAGFVCRVEEARGGFAVWRHSVSLPRSSNRTCRFPASGFPTGFFLTHTTAHLFAGLARKLRVPQRCYSMKTDDTPALATCAGAPRNVVLGHRRSD